VKPPGQEAVVVNIKNTLHGHKIQAEFGVGKAGSGAIKPKACESAIGSGGTAVRIKKNLAIMEH
jgi:hypothetical protein